MTDKPCCCNEFSADRICPVHPPMDRYVIGEPMLFKGEPAIGYLYGFNARDGSPQFASWHKMEPIVYATWQEPNDICDRLELGVVIVVTSEMLRLRAEFARQEAQVRQEEQERNL